MVTEEADGLQDDPGVTFVAHGFQGVFDGRADPWASGDTLALEGEEPSLEIGKFTRGCFEDQRGGALGFDRIRVGRGLHRRSGARSGDARFAGHDGAAGDGVGSEQDGQSGTSVSTYARVDSDEALGESFNKGGLFGPLFYEGKVDLCGGGIGVEGSHEGAAVESDAGA